MHLGNLSHSGAGLLIVEATGVAPEGRISPSCPGLWHDANEAAFARVLAAVRRYSPIALGIQAGIGVETLVTVHQLAQGRFVRCSGSLIG